MNDGATWESEAQALAGIPSGARYIGQFVNIQNELFWFLDDLTTLTSVKEALKPKANELLIDDVDGLFAAENVEAALMELMNKVIEIKNPYVVTLSAAASISGKIAGAVIPTGWSLADQDGTGLIITHNLADREVSNVVVKEINGETARFCVPFSEGFTGISETGNDIIIEGLNLADLVLKIFIFFS